MSAPPPVLSDPSNSSAAGVFHAIVPCAGAGVRSGVGGPKQYARLAGRPMVMWTLRALAGVAELRTVLVALAPGDTQFAALLAAEPPGLAARCESVECGGATRAETVANALRVLVGRGAADTDWVLVHDAARCLVTPSAVRRLIDACADDPVGGLLALPLADTLKHARRDGDSGAEQVDATLDRAGKWAAQTPQMFRLGLLRQALAQADVGITDESGAVEALGYAPRLVRGSLENFKLTYPEDFPLAERLLAGRASMPPALPPYRIGEGWDVHALVAGRPLVLGGVTIPHSHGLLGHSDADALAHAITDALFGGAGLGDIGRHFPDTDAAFAGADSMALLAEALRRVRAAGYAPVNVDATIVAQAPKLAPHIPAIRQRLAEVLELPPGQVNVKAKTAEQMGPVGERRAIEARAVCLLARLDGPPA